MRKILLMAALAGSMIGGSSCSRQADISDNPFFAEWDTPFGIPPFEKIYARHFLPAIEEGIRRENREIKAIVKNSEPPSFENVILPFTGSGAFLQRPRMVFENLSEANATDSLLALQEVIYPLLTEHGNNIILNGKLFDKIKTVYDERDRSGLDAQQMRLVEKVYRRFAANGAALPADQQAKLRELDERLSRYGIAFGNNMMKEMADFKVVVEDEADLAGLPEGVKRSAADAAKEAGLAGKWVFTLDKPSMIPFLQYADNRNLRRQLYEGYLNRNNRGNAYDNKALVDSIVNTRTERAQLLGFPSHAAFVLQNRMAGTPENVYSMLNKLWVPAMMRADDERDELQALMKKEIGNDDFASWDWWYYAEKINRSKYGLSDDVLRPYFPLDGVREGIFKLADTLYGITFRPVADAPAYHDECRTYEVLDRDGSHLGVVMLDFFPRKGKQVGAWCSSFREQSYQDGKRVAPLVTIVCNFTRPSDDMPALLNLDEVNTFFHEFGHGIHSLVSDVHYDGLRDVATDFVELPSQIMENWSVAPEMLKLYARHYRTGEPMPDALIEKIGNSGLFNQGFLTTENLAASYLDMDYHSNSMIEPIDPTDFESYSLEGRMITPQVAPRYRSTYFGHIFSGGYSAGYYSYMWAEAMDADAYGAFLETGDIFDKQTADRFRRLLEQGGTKDEAELYREFRGRDVDQLPLMKRRGLVE